MDQDGVKYSAKDVDNSKSENRRVLKTFLKCHVMYLFKVAKPNNKGRGTKNKEREVNQLFKKPEPYYARLKTVVRLTAM